MLHYTKLPSGHSTNNNSNPPIVILHGLLGMGNNWRTFARQLISSLENTATDVYLPDLPNHGQSPHQIEMDYPTIANNLVSWLEETNLSTPIVLMGHSMGGKVATAFAKNYPDLVSRLIVLDMGVQSRNVNYFHRLINSLLKIDLSEFTQRRLLEEKISQVIENPNLASFLGKNLAWSNNQFTWKCALENIFHQLPQIGDAIHFKSENHETINLPSLFIKGNKSDYLNSEEKIVISKIFNQVTFTEIEAGHWLHQDNPSQLLIETKKFITQI